MESSTTALVSYFGSPMSIVFALIFGAGHIAGVEPGSCDRDLILRSDWQRLEVCV